MANRRTFLQLFGVTAAAVPLLDGAGGVTVARDPSIKPLGPVVRERFDHSYKEVVRAQLYSAAELSGAAMCPRADFFGYGLGQVVPWTGWDPFRSDTRAATLSDTNMERPYELPPYRAFLVETLGLVFSPADGFTARERFLDSAVFTLWLENKMYWRAPAASMFNVVTGDRLLTGAVSIASMPLVIPPGLPFRAEVQGGEIPQGHRLRVYAVLEGFEGRSIQ